jgi:formate hydrogenlyase subunit 6/NADH:ubiquinone oxidoreductase subunit I
MKPGDRVVVDCGKGFSALCASLRERGFRLFGPTVRDGAIVYDEISSIADLPAGWTDEQQEGRYRLKRREDGAFFGYAVGPQSWKRFLHVPVLTLWRAHRDSQGFRIEDADDGAPTLQAFIGVRACELAAIAVQDRVFLGGPHVDSAYKKRRAGAFLVAVNCGQAGGTCFCASMKTGPRATTGFDLALTELLEDGRHAFLVEVGSERGAEVASELPGKPASKKDVAAAEAAVERAEVGMGRTIETSGLKDLLYRSYESPRWDDVARRCLACTNCTMVCPTCFCATVEDVTDLSGSEARRVRRWDSCFTLDFSYVHGGSVRTSMEARYRQWIIHKLASWQDQFGTSGCVGCGRCITWCPVGIDITAEARAVREADEQRRERRGNGDL